MHVLKEFSSQIIIEKSRFICYIEPCNSEEEYKSTLAFLRKKYYDASHVCSAFIINNQKRSSDDGEPSGTAGIPILNVLEKNNMNNVGAFVVRYFGGIKLGAGGLNRAYGNSVSECLKICELYETKELKKYKIEVPYNMSKDLSALLKNNSQLINEKYEENAIYEFAIENDSLIDSVLSITKGIKPIYLGIEKVDKIVK